MFVLQGLGPTAARPQAVLLLQLQYPTSHHQQWRQPWRVGCAGYNSSAADYWRAELDAVVAERKPRVGSHSMAWRGASHVSTLWLRLPLASNGSDVDMILGYDAVIGMQAERSAQMSGIRAA